MCHAVPVDSYEYQGTRCVNAFPPAFMPISHQMDQERHSRSRSICFEVIESVDERLDIWWISILAIFMESNSPRCPPSYLLQTRCLCAVSPLGTMIIGRIPGGHPNVLSPKLIT